MGWWEEREGGEPIHPSTDRSSKPVGGRGKPGAGQNWAANTLGRNKIGQTTPGLQRETFLVVALVLFVLFVFDASEKVH